MDVSTRDQFTVEFGERGTRATQLKDTVAEPHQPKAAVQAAQTVSTNTAPRTIKALVQTAPTVSTNTAPRTIVDNLGEIRHSGMSTDMYEKLVRLASLPAGWRGPGSQALRVSSLNQFLQFWSLVRQIAVEPELALAPDGSIHAEWFKSSRQRLDIRFAKSGARFGMFANNNILEGADRRLDAVADKLKSDNARPLTWHT
jgi:hypothetical protein